MLLQVNDGAPTSLRAFFPPAPAETDPQRFVPELLPAYETAFAMTIHKSQGSPYACDFIGYCWSDVPAYSVLNLRGKSEAKWALFNEGCRTTLDIPEGPDLQWKQQRLYGQTEPG